jgi:hypothetical protein
VTARPELHSHINVSIQAIPLFQHHPYLLGTKIWILKDSFTELFILTKIPIDDNKDNEEDYEDDKNYDEDLKFSWLCVLQIVS